MTVGIIYMTGLFISAQFNTYSTEDSEQTKYSKILNLAQLVVDLFTEYSEIFTAYIYLDVRDLVEYLLCIVE